MQNALFEDARYKSGISFIDYLQRKIDFYHEVGKASAASKLAVTLKVFCNFLSKNNFIAPNKSFCFEDLTDHLLILFERELQSRYLSPNTTSFYMRILRSHYYQGVEDGLFFSITDPFRRVFTGVCKTKKRAISKNEFSQLIQAELPKKLQFAKDLFLFSFYTRGMSLIDIAQLKRENIFKDEIRYCRRKTGQLIKINIEPCIREIIDKYSNMSGSNLIFPIMEKNGQRLQYNTSLKNINNNLLKISKLLNFNCRLTTYVARHTWASVAKWGGIPTSVISECMGHTSERTTQIYLSTIEQESIDDANRLVIHSLNKNLKCSITN